MDPRNMVRRTGKSLKRNAVGLRQLLGRVVDGSAAPRRQLDASQLEDRVLFSAAPLDAVPQEMHDPNVTADMDHGVFPHDPTTDVGVLESDGQSHEATFGIDLLDQTDPSDLSDLSDPLLRHELVFVDTSTPDHQQLVDDLLANHFNGTVVDVILLEGSADGVSQISQALAQYDNVDAIHLVSHGADGAVKLGNTSLRMNTLDAHSGKIATWHDSLADDADLLIYGCNLAAGQEGQALIEAISELTGADVAASVDNTGHAQLAGDWELEYTVGLIETDIAFSVEVQQNWFGVLDNITFQHGAAGYSGTQDTYLWGDIPNTPVGSDPDIQVDVTDNGQPQHGLIRFDNIFGSGAGQIPYGSTINSASLTVNVFDPSAGGATIGLHRMLVDWSEATATWNSMTNGIQPNDIEASSAADGTLVNPGGSGAQSFTDLAGALQAWSDGAPNYGWAIFSNDADGWDARSSEYGTVASRPLLAVDYTPPVAGPTITSRETIDNDGNGKIDYIRITTDQALDDDFSGLTMTVSGYTVSGYATNIGAGGANDNVFYVQLTESGSPDTGVTPTVAVTANTTLSEFGGSNNIATDGGASTTDAAAPVITARETVDNDADGQIDYIKVTTSENVDDDFNGLTMTVGSYSLDGATPFVTNLGAGGVNDNVFYIKLVESGTPDTGATPTAMVTANTTLSDLTNTLQIEADTQDIVIEAENFATNTSLDGTHNWTLMTTIVGYSGSGYMQALPDSGFNVDPFDPASGAEMSYNFNVTTPGTYYLHARYYAAVTSDDSFWWSIDGAAPTKESIGAVLGSWQWATGDVTVALSAGSHTLRLFMREAGERIDQIVIDQNSTPPSGVADPFAGTTATDKAAPVLLSASSNRANGSNLFQSVGDQLDLVFSETIGSLATEGQLEGALRFLGGATDGDNLPSIGSGVSPFSLVTTSSTNDTIQVTLNTNNTLNSDLLLVGTHSVEVNNGTSITDLASNRANNAAAAVPISGATNTPPTITNLAGDALAYAEDSGPLLIDQGNNATVTDVDSADFNGGNLTVAIVTGVVPAEDVLSIRNQGMGAGQIGFSAGNVYYGGVLIGTAAGGSGGANLVVTLNANATPVAVTALVRNVTYEDTNTANPSEGTLTVRFTLIDGDGGTSAASDATVTVSRVNDLPTAADGTVTTNEDTTYTFTAADFNFADVDGDAMLQIQITALETAGSLKYNGFDVTLNQVISKADIDLNLLTFEPAPNASGIGYDSFQFRVHDGTEYSATQVTTLVNADFAADASGFTYVDDAFGTSEPSATSGSWSATGGNGGGGSLQVHIQYETSNPMSGAWTRNITLAEDSWVRIQFDYDLILAGGYDSNEYGEAIFEVDSVRYGSDVNNSLVHIVGDGDSGPPMQAGYATHTETIFLSAGTHTLAFGVYNNTATDLPNEYLDAYFDNILVEELHDYKMTVDVTPVNGVPTAITPTGFAVDETTNTTGGYSLGTLSTTDPDSPESFSYSIVGGADAANFSIGGAGLDELVLDDGVLDFASKPSYTVIVRVTDSGANTHDQTITVNVNDLNGVVSAISDTNATANTVAESAAVGSSVGITAFATDPDLTDTVTYSLDDSAGGRFAIDTNTGLITLSGGLDFENASSHNVTVRATSSDGSFTTRVFTISVSDVNESPTAITPTSFAVNENTNTAGGYSVGTLSTTDPDSPESFTYTIVGGADAARFSIGGAGSNELVLDDGTLNLEAKSSYAVVVRVTDSGGLTRDATITVNVNNLNDAPLLDSSGSMTLTDVNEDDTNPPGNTVAAIIASAGGDRITDQDSGAVEGIAVIGVDDTNGQWQYSTTGGATWLAFGPVSDNSAVLLDTAALVRFVPNANYNGPAGNLTLRAWDQTSGASGDTGVDVSANGGSTPYSNATETASLNVNPVNDAPVLDNTGVMTLSDINEDDTNPVGDTLAAILASAGGDRITDVDTGALEGFAVVGVDNSNGQWQYSTDGGATWLAFGAASDSSAVLLDTAARVRFVPNANYAGSAGNVTYRAWDQTTGSSGATGVNVSTNGGTTAFSSATETATLNVNPVNDAPVASNDTYTVSQSQILSVGAAGVLSNDTDIDGDPLTAVLVSGPSSGTLTLSADGSFVYTLGPGFQGADSFTYQVDDGSSISNTATVSIVQPLAPPPPPPPLPPPPPSPPPSPGGTVNEPINPIGGATDPPVQDSGSQTDPSSAGQQDIGSTAAPEGQEPYRLRAIRTENPAVLAANVAAESEPWEVSTDTYRLTAGFRRDPYIGTARFESSRLDVMEIATLQVDEAVQLDDDALWSQLDDLAHQLASHGQVTSVTHVVLTATGAAFSVGFVAWTIRASYLTATLMSSLPAWHRLDPLPVLDFAAAKSRDQRRSSETSRSRGLLDAFASEAWAEAESSRRDARAAGKFRLRPDMLARHLPS
jgi:Tfp pilus assembly protein FimT